MVSGVSPFHHPGAGKLTSTVSWPGTAGVLGDDPFCPVISQVPNVCACAPDATSSASAAPIATPISDECLIPPVPFIAGIVPLHHSSCFAGWQTQVGGVVVDGDVR